MNRSRNSPRGIRLGAIERDILENLTLGDLLVGFLCSSRSTHLMYKVARKRALARYRTQKAIDRLVLEGYIKRNGETLSISTAGKHLIEKTIRQVYSKLSTKNWDGKWRIITFDIPEKYRSTRNQIRAILKHAGFVELQHSTWIFPHECQELSTLIKHDTRLAKYVLYGVLESIENDTRLRQIFGLT